MRKTLKIAMVAPVYTKESTWGVVTVIKKIVAYLKSKEYIFSVYAVNAASSNKLANLPIQECIDGASIKRYKPLLGISSYQITPLMFLDLLRDDFDIIHAHDARSFQLNLAAFISVLRNKPLVISAHGSLADYLYLDNMSPKLRSLHRVHNILLKFSLCRANIVMALSELEAEQYLKLFGVQSKKIITLPNGIDLSLYENLPPEGAFKKKFGIASHIKIILYVGRVNKIKGIEFLINSFSYLVKNFKSERALLVIAGPDDGYLEEANDLCNSLEISDKILFTGFLEEQDKLCAYVDATVVVHPESYNVILIAPLEAAATGKPIILSSGNYLSKIARREGFGLSTKYGDIVSMASLLHKVINDFHFAEVMGTRGREFVLKNWNWSKITAVYDKVYRSIA
ncbi:glycosyltransferase family 4 protein [Candidatus Bathyarchaeota archaeon]|nr:glycosyltransferase family 4 protein [Candidatus Bathyarchaeota archaeon]